MELTSRERVRRMFQRQEIDRTPIDFGGTVVTCIDVHAHENLCRYLNIPCAPQPIIDYSMGTVEPCEKLMRMFGSDFRRVGLNGGVPDIVNNTFENGFGVGGGIYYNDSRYAETNNLVVLPSYTRIDGTLFYRKRHYDVALNIRNLSNTDYFESAHTNYQIMPGAPINGTLTTRFRW
jgi:hypothetical protein